MGLRTPYLTSWREFAPGDLAFEDADVLAPEAAALRILTTCFTTSCLGDVRPTLASAGWACCEGGRHVEILSLKISPVGAFMRSGVASAEVRDCAHFVAGASER